MHENYWKEDKKVIVESKLPNCSADKYFCPEINKIKTEIFCDDSYFLPNYSGSHGANIYANLTEDFVKINNFGTILIDCGFSIKIPAGYKVCSSLNEHLSSKGLFINDNCKSNEKSKFKINLINLGESQVTIHHKENLGILWIEPIYYFDWD